MWLQNLSHSWLLILDNADNTELDLAQFLPAGKKGSILITTRLTQCARHGTAGKDHYEKLNQETAIDLLLKTCDIGSGSWRDYADNAREVTELLGCHALAVIQAGAAVSQNLCSLGDYKKIFLNQRRTLLECSPGQARSEYGGVYATFEVSATCLEARNDQIAKDALELLNFYAFMHFSDFPEVAFEEAWKNSKDETIVSSQRLSDGEENIRNLAPWHVSHLLCSMGDDPHDVDLNKIRLRKAMSLLISFSLVTFDSDRGTTRMHPVSHFWSRDRLQEREQSTNAGLNGLSLLSLSIDDPYAVDPSPLSKQLQPHIESVAYSLKEWDYPKHDFHFQQTIYRLSYVMYRSSHDSALFELLQMIPIQVDESWIRSENGQSVQLLHSRAMHKFGDANEAVILLERVSEILVQTLAAEDPQVLNSQHGLAIAYLEIGDTTKAIELLERIVQTRHETLAPEHENLLDSQHELARAYLDVEETDKAIVLFEEVVNIQARRLSPEHPNRLVSQHELARAYLKIEQGEKAIPLLEKVVEITTRTLRPEHLDHLASQHELARAYLAIKETDKAIALLEEVNRIRTRTLRPEHLDRLKSHHELARAYLAKEETEKAVALLEEVVEIQTRTLRPEHPLRLMSQHELARAYMGIEEVDKAIVLLKEVVEIKARTLRPEHQERLKSQYTLAKAYMAIKETEKAIALLEDVVKTEAKTLRPEHPDRLGSQHELARAYRERGEIAKAIHLLESVVKIRTKTLRGDHPSRVRSIYVLAECYDEEGDYKRALELARSIENVAWNRGSERIAEWNAQLIGLILEAMDRERTT